MAASDKAIETWPILSVRQPWAWAIFHAGKNVENRTWRTAYRGRFWIHAAGKPAAKDDWAFVAERLGGEVPDELPRGVVLGSVELVDCVSIAGEDLFAETAALRDNPWAFGPECWVLGDPRPAVEPMPCLGRLGLWTPKGELLTRLIDKAAS